MKLICPSCGGTHSAEAWLNDAVIRQCLILVGSMEYDISSCCFSYLALFRPSGKALAWKKVLKLLSELKDMTQATSVSWKNQAAMPSNSKIWGMALERLLDNPPMRLPLKSHGYLRSIAYEIATEFDRQNEVKRNQTERNGTFRRKQDASPESERISFEEMKKITEQNYRNRKK